MLLLELIFSKHISMYFICFDFRILRYDSCENLYREIQSVLVTWSYENRSSDLYGQLSANIRLKLKQFQSSIEQLTEQLNKITREQLMYYIK